ncbi:MAG TPA: hypothetical protein VHZ29_07515 [Rhizomicrobium sp.]|nr:hypothetical protein [Rhizomicrobium sp.]
MQLDVLASSPALYPFAYDPARDALMFVRMDEAAYRAASFLDERMNVRGEWAPAAAVEQALAGARDVRALHFIFHAGHVGSTLLSRLLDEARGVLSLREPLPLRVVAEHFSPARLEMLLRLWERGFESTQAVVLKATSSTERLAATLLAMRPQSRAVMLNVGAETYLATMLAGENSAADLNAQGAERMHRLATLLGAPAPRPATLGELIAMSWAAERLTQADAVRALGARALAVDFDAMLEDVPGTMARVLAHFGLRAEDGRFAASAALSRYSKAPEHAYSPSLRRELLTQARKNFASEIRDALGWLENLNAAHPDKSVTL